MSMYPMLKRPFIALLALTLVGSTIGRADEPPKKDDALDRLLEKLDAPSPTPDPKAGADDAQAKSRPESDQAKTKADANKEKTASEIAPKDQALDSLLEKLGETKDRPDARDERRGGPS